MATALVLSAGGMFGAWQAGVWRALSRTLKPDLVIGASAGAINGWMIAGGRSPDEVAASWMDPENARVIRPRFGPLMTDPEPLCRSVRALMERSQPKIPYATVLAEIPRLRPALIRGEEMTWRHLVAACSIPLVFPPVRIDGRKYVDGGLLGVLPLWAAAELGADRAIAINALPKMPSRVVRAAARFTQALARPRRPPEAFPVTLILPSAPLGNLRAALYWNEENARRWIELGEQDGMVSITM